MKERKRKNKKILGLINVVVIVYIFTLAIGYSFFRESLKISGNVSTDIPSDCPFKMINVGDLVGVDNNLYRRYFIEYQDYNDLISLANKGQYSELQASAIDRYEQDNNIYSLYVDSFLLYPNDPNNTTTVLNRYKTFASPMYFIFQNTTSYDLDSFIISPDYDNYYDYFIDPLIYFDVRWFTTSDLDDVIEMINDDYQYDDEAWINLPSALEHSSIYDVQEYDGGSVYYNYEEFFNNGEEVEFSTDPVGTGEYLVLGIKFPDVEWATYDEWRPGMTVGSYQSYYYPVTEPMGFGFEFWPSNFKEESAFKMRIASHNMYDYVYNFIANIGNTMEGFYNEPWNYPFPVDWWETP